MTDDWVPQETLATLKLLAWVPLKRYCRIVGELPGTVHTRISRGTWKMGVQVNKPKGGDLWVNLLEVQLWASGKKSIPAHCLEVYAEFLDTGKVRENRRPRRLEADTLE